MATDKPQLMTIADAVAWFAAKTPPEIITKDWVRARLKPGPRSGRRKLSRYETGEGVILVDVHEIEELRRVELVEPRDAG